MYVHTYPFTSVNGGIFFLRLQLSFTRKRRLNGYFVIGLQSSLDFRRFLESGLRSGEERGLTFRRVAGYRPTLGP